MAAIVVLDQVTKALVVRSLALHEYVPLVDGLLSLSHVRNRGAAFGILSDWDLPYQSVLLSALSLRRPARDRRSTSCGCPRPRGCPALALALVLGGAVGNLIDRAAPRLRGRLRPRVLAAAPVARLQRRRLRHHRRRDACSCSTSCAPRARAPADAEPGIDAAAPTAGRID